MLKPKKKNHQLITIPVTWDLKYTDVDAATTEFKANLYTLLDPEDKEYYPMEIDIVDAESYRGGRLGIPGHLTALLTYEVPEKFDRFLISGTILIAQGM